MRRKFLRLQKSFKIAGCQRFDPASSCSYVFVSQTPSTSDFKVSKTYAKY